MFLVLISYPLEVGSLWCYKYCAFCFPGGSTSLALASLVVESRLHESKPRIWLGMLIQEGKKKLHSVYILLFCYIFLLYLLFLQQKNILCKASAVPLQLVILLNTHPS